MAPYSLMVFVFGAMLLAVAEAQEDKFDYNYGFNPTQTVVETVNYDHDGEPLQGYVVYNNRTKVARPAVLIVPDFDGIGPYELWRAKLIAQMGYTAFVTDIYGSTFPDTVTQEGGLPDQLVQGPELPQPLRGQLSRHYSSQPELLVARLLAGVDTVKTQATVDPTALAAIGYCFGGGAVITLARSWPNGTDGVRGVMAFHPGGIINNQTFAAGNPIRVSVQHGYNDPAPGDNQTAVFKAQAEAANVTWEWTDYGKTAHGFTLPHAIGNLTTPTYGYSKDADVRSWWALRGFLLDIFNKRNATNIYSASTLYDYSTPFANFTKRTSN